jgi:hypothetical protein
MNLLDIVISIIFVLPWMYQLIRPIPIVERVARVAVYGLRSDAGENCMPCDFRRLQRCLRSKSN